MAQFPQIIKLKNDKEMLIREAESHDAGLLIEYIERVSGETNFLSFGPGEFEMSEEEEADYLSGCAERDHCLYLLAFVDGNMVGTLHFSSRNRSRIIHVGDFGITVQKAFWGFGIGNVLMDALIDWATASTVIKKINLKVRTDNQRAIQLYLKKGFTVEGVMKMENFVDGKYYDIMLMALIV